MWPSSKNTSDYTVVSPVKVSILPKSTFFFFFFVDCTGLVGKILFSINRMSIPILVSTKNSIQSNKKYVGLKNKSCKGAKKFFVQLTFQNGNKIQSNSFYVLCPCRLFQALHNFLSFVALSKFCLLNICLSLCSAIHLLAVSLYPCCFQCSCECQILQAFFPYFFHKFHLSLSDSKYKCPFHFPF